MIRKYMIMLFLVMGIALTSCGGKKDKGETDSAKEDQEQTMIETGVAIDSVPIDKKMLMLQDSIRAINKRIDATGEIAQTTKQALEDEVSGLRGMIWALGGFCVLCLLLSFIVVIWCRNLQRQGNGHRKAIKELQNKMPQEKTIAASSSIQKVSTKEYLDLQDRISRMEKVVRTMTSSMDAMTKAHSTPQQPATATVAQSKQNVEKRAFKAYFGTPSLGDQGGYFRKQFDYLDSDARFAAEISENKAIFTPIIDSEAAKKTLLTSDQMKLAVEYSGCTPSEMKAMKVQSAGVAEKKENDRWVIVKKVQIQLM